MIEIEKDLQRLQKKIQRETQKEIEFAGEQGFISGMEYIRDWLNDYFDSTGEIIQKELEKEIKENNEQLQNAK